MALLSEAQRAVRAFAVMRAAVTTLLAGIVAMVSLWAPLPFSLWPFVAVMIVSYLLSLLCWILTPHARRPERLAEGQIYADVVLETVLIYVTGGPYSAFPFMYLLSILAMSIVVSPRRSFAAATASVLLHGLLLALQFHHWIPPASSLGVPRNVVLEGSLTILLISGNVCASYLVAYLGTHLAEHLRQARGLARRTEASLAELQVLHEDILQSVSSGLATFDRDGLLTTVNRTAEALARRSQSALRGARWEAFFDQAPTIADIWDVLRRRDRVPFRFEARLGRGDGSRIPVGVSASFLRRGLGIVCSFQDLTQIRRMEERVRHADRLAALGRFAAGLAHEIRNPLGSIRGSVEVLRESLSPRGDDRRLMEIILRESDRLDGIIAEFLDFSRPPAPSRIETDLVGLVEEILLLLSHQPTGPSGVRIVRQYGDGTIKAPVDAGQIRQALWNLCRNALDAMPEGGELRVGIRGPDGDQRPGAVELVVEDTGVGMTPDQVAQAFEPFYTTKPTGTGLGLAIVHRVVEDHGGEIRVDSRPGAGTRFTVVLPLESE
jgi:two-component system sensor histidine kinase PilS (NtrC family)